MKRKELIINLTSNFFSSFIVGLCGVLSPWILVKILDLDDYSFFSFFLIIQTILSAIDLGLPIVLNKCGAETTIVGKSAVSRAKNLIAFGFYFSFVLTLIVFLYLLNSKPTISSINTNSINLVLLFVALSIFPKIINISLISYLRGRNLHLLSSKIIIVGTLSRFLIPLISLKILGTLVSYFLCLFILSFLEIIVLYQICFGHRFVLGKVNLISGINHLRRNFKFTSQVFFGALIGILFSNIDKLYLRFNTDSLSYAGYFSSFVIASLVSLSSSAIFQSFSGNLVVAYKKNLIDIEINRYSRLILYTSITTFLVIAFAGKAILFLWSPILSDGNFQKTLTLLSCAFVCSVFASILGSIQVAADYIKPFFLSNFTVFLLFLILLFFLNIKTPDSLATTYFFCALISLFIQMKILYSNRKLICIQAIKIILAHLPLLFFVAIYSLNDSDIINLYKPYDWISAVLVCIFALIAAFSFEVLYYKVSIKIINLMIFEKQLRIK